MPTREQLEEGIRRAHAAGDANSVRALGAELMQQRAVEQQPKITSTSRIGGLVSGVMKPIDNLAEAASNIPGIGPAVDRASNALGMPTAADAAAGNQSYRQSNSRSGYQTLGNMLGTLPTLAIPGGALVQGGASGALLSDKRNASGIVNDVATGAVSSKAGQMVAGGIGYLASPIVSKTSRILADAKVPQTLGQIAAGGKSLGAKIITKGEEALTSVPLLGDAINAARGRGVDGFQLAVGNRALANVGKKIPKGMEPGQLMVDYVTEQLSDSYDSLVPKLTAVFDRKFVGDLVAAKAVTKTLPAARQKQFASILDDVFTSRASGSRITGQNLKDAESRLGEKIRNYATSTNGDERELANALKKVRDGLRGSVSRSNPQYADELQAINKGWAQARVMKNAANSPGNATGEFTPAQALRASKKSGYTKDDLVRAAKATLPNTTPDSGTARRGAMTLGALMTGGGTAAVTVNPWLAVPAAGSLLYTKAGQKAMNKLVFAPRGKALQATGKGLRGAARVAPGVIPALLKDDR